MTGSSVSRPTSRSRSTGTTTAEDNADAHLKRQLMAHQVVLAITDGRLDLGPWEQVFYAEFDGRRRKRVVLKAIGD
jgi:secondary thiamine-phosphate synthase enzyme